MIFIIDLERAMGIEPTSEAWEASILPMNYAREKTGKLILTPDKPIRQWLFSPLSRFLAEGPGRGAYFRSVRPRSRRSAWPSRAAVSYTHLHARGGFTAYLMKKILFSL